MDKVYDLIIVGGGVSGCVAAINSARKGLKVLVLEQSNRLLKKLSLTGNGQCNLANSNKVFGKFNSGFPNKIMSIISLDTILDFYNSIDVYVVEDDERWYPYSKHSATVVNAFIKKLNDLGVDIVLDCDVTNIKKINDEFIVNDMYVSKFLLLATGSNAKIGKDSLELLEKLGHKVNNFKASLIHIYTDTEKIKGLNGVRVYSCKATLEVDEKIVAQSIGDIIFRDYGLSGSAIFDLSVALARASEHKNASIILDFFPNDKMDLEHIIETHKGVEALLHKSLAVAIRRSSKSNLAKDLAKEIKYFKLSNANLGPINLAQVASGGVDCSFVSNVSLESKIIDKLYITGELLDVDGVCGGYNLMWAVASGLAASNNIIEEIKS